MSSALLEVSEQRPQGKPHENGYYSDPAAAPILPDFSRACLLAVREYTKIGNTTRRECEAVGLPHDAAFWYQCAAEARQAGDWYAHRAEQVGEHRARTELLPVLWRKGWYPLYEALESGDYRKNLLVYQQDIRCVKADAGKPKKEHYAVWDK